jgi:hypothetical protein
MHPARGLSFVTNIMSGDAAYDCTLDAALRLRDAVDFSSPISPNVQEQEVLTK